MIDKKVVGAAIEFLEKLIQTGVFSNPSLCQLTMHTIAMFSHASIVKDP